MYLLSDKQIDFIYDDLKQKGIVTDDLQLNLVDHICCILEEELETEAGFDEQYNQVVRRFYKNSLDELEEETHLLLTFKHFYLMKKLMIVSGVGSVAVLAFGIILKYLYSPGATVMICGGILMLSLVFLPLYFTLKIKEEKQGRDKILIGLTSLVCISISLAILFKVMHWPGANALGLTSLFTLLLGFLPVYFITGIRNPDNKVNTIVSSVLIIAGCGLFLTLTRSPKGTEIQQQALTNQLVRSEMILQSELKLLHKFKTEDSSALGFRLTRLCEELKREIVLNETGCPSLIADQGCKAVLIRDGSLNHEVLGNPKLMKQQDELNNLIKQYNQAIVSGGQSQIPVQPIMTESVSGTIQYLIQIEMFVLQNERQLLASN
jgi:hypothetical protein